MNFSAWSIRNPIAPILIFVLLMVVGWSSFNRLPITRFPNIDFPLVAVTVAQPGAAPSELETQVTKEVEDAVAGLAGVKNVVSNITDGVSTTLIEFRMEVPGEKAVQDTKDAIDGIRGALPGEVETPNVFKIDVEGQAILTFAVKSPEMSFEEISWFVDDTVKRALQGRAGVGRIDRYGGADREVRVTLDPAKLDAFGITALSVSQQLRATNTNAGAGRSEVGAAEQAIRTLGDTQTVEGLATTPIALPGGRFVTLADLGQVSDTYEELRSFSRLNGEPVVTFAVFRSKGASEVSVNDVVQEQVEALRAAHPNVTIEPVDDLVYFTYGNYEAAMHSLLEGAALAVIVVFLFLRNWRATLISAIALPLSAVPTFFVMSYLGFSLNLVSLLALTLATGILVDDAIVEIENIARHIKMGKTPFRASIEAADEIGLAVIATTMTIVAVFVPVSFMSGIAGQYFRQFGLTVAVSVLFSLLVARLITPMMAAYLMRASDGDSHEASDGFVMRGYLGLVRIATSAFRGAHYLTFAVAIAVLVGSGALLMQVPGAFMPPEDSGRISIKVELPPGSTLAETERTTDLIFDKIKDIEWIDDIFVLGGSSPTGDLDVRVATVTVLLDKLDHSLLLKLSQTARQIPVLGWIVPEVQDNGRTKHQRLIEAEIFERLKDVPDIRAIKLNDRGAKDLTYDVRAPDQASLDRAVGLLESALRQQPTLVNVAAEGAMPRPEVQIRPRAEEAARLGITTQTIAAVLRVATIGDMDAALAKVSLDGRLVPVRVRLNDDLREDVNRIANLRVPTATGASVPLSAVADISVTDGPASVKRLNRERRAELGANLAVGVAQGTAKEAITTVLAGLDLPPGVTVKESGDAEAQTEVFAAFGDAMILGLLLMMFVMILLFKSVLQPITIIFSLFLSVGGVAVALLLTGSSLSMPVLIGILMLMGVVSKNAILIVDFAIEMRRRGMTRAQAVIEAGHKRARPIVMTSIAMSAGMLPSALGVGEGGAFRSPMATAVIGGIIVSTVLSLVVVPAVYLMMDDLQWLITRLFSRMVGPKEEEPEAPPNDILAERIALLAAEQADLRERIGALSEDQRALLDDDPRLNRSGMAAE